MKSLYHEKGSHCCERNKATGNLLKLLFLEKDLLNGFTRWNQQTVEVFLKKISSNTSALN